MVDLNGDGKPDLVATTNAGFAVDVFMGNGDGTFQPRKLFFNGFQTGSGAIGDFNQDGRPDVVATPLNPFVNVFLNAQTFTGQVYTVTWLLLHGDGERRPWERDGAARSGVRWSGMRHPGLEPGTR